MSLFIVGSCSMFTQRVILALSEVNLYKRIVILDPLPFYHFHNRFYALQKRLVNTSTSVEIRKMISMDDISMGMQTHKNTLFVPHDYFSCVIAKEKIMQFTAEQAVKTQTPLVIAAPYEYYHMKEDKPFLLMQNALYKSKVIMPKCTVLTAEGLDGCELAAYMKRMSILALFRKETRGIKLVKTSVFAGRVVTALSKKEENGLEHYQGTQETLDPSYIDGNSRHTLENMKSFIRRFKQERPMKCSAQI